MFKVILVWRGDIRRGVRVRGRSFSSCLPNLLGDRGQVTLIAAALIAVLLLFTLGAAKVANAAIRRAEARGVADAVALAAAQDPVAGHALADRYIAKSGGTLRIDISTSDSDGTGSSDSSGSTEVTRVHVVADPSQATAWARLRSDEWNEAAFPVTVAIVARSEQLVGAQFASKQIAGSRVKLDHLDAAQFSQVAHEFDYCLLEQTPSHQIFDRCF